ncbi:MAG: cache domain-containing protein [Nitrospirae bacterium]|nr:cache domain-containing protein [Nitrospirota bacterium]
MFKSKVFRKAFFVIFLIVVANSVTIFFMTVPLITKTIYDLDENSGKTILENVYNLVDNSYQDIETYKQLALEAHKRELKNITFAVTGFIEQGRKDIEAGKVQEAKGKEKILEDIRHFIYGNNDYVFITDYDSRLLSHPDEKLNKTDLSQLRDIHGNLIVPPAVDLARRLGDGYTSYWWRRLGEKEPVEKLTYCSNYNKWKWVICTGVYIDDIKNEVQRKRAKAIESLSQSLNMFRIGKTGYMYIFDSKKNMIIHPNKQIERTNVAGMLDPSTGKPIIDELMAVSSLENNRIEYKWDKPIEPGHYVYDKIAWIKYHKGLDWYVVSSVYKKELNESADKITRRIFTVSILVFLISSTLGYMFIKRLIEPINKLSYLALRVQDGDFGQKSGIKGDDEICTLAMGFDTMVERMKHDIDNLDNKVLERTQELDVKNRELENSLTRLKETVANLDHSKLQNQFLSEFLMKLTRNMDNEKIWDVALYSLMSAAGCQGGAIMLREDKKLKIVHARGFDPEFLPDDGFSSEHGLMADACYSDTITNITLPEGHPLTFNAMALGTLPSKVSVMPLSVREKGKGILVLAWVLSEGSRLTEETLLAASGALSVVIDNIQMLNKFKNMAAFDELTGMYNRRFGLKRLKEEEARQLRDNQQFSISLIDIDHFKRVNDTYGHQAGDEVLRRVSQLLYNEKRSEDIIIRYGGEEIILLLIGASPKEAALVVERIRAACEATPVVWNDALINVTFSAGIAGYREDARPDTIETLIERADQRLYLAKQNGRNRIES